MNVLHHLPNWAKAPTRNFIDHSSIEGTTSTPLTEETFVESFKRGAGAAELAAYDEVPREDQAMGRPGVVSRNGLTIYHSGDSSKSRGEFEVVLSSRRRGVEYVTYVHSRGSNEFSVLRLVNDEGDVEVEGSKVKKTAQGPDGFFLSGNFYL